jgi:hypothetical protein
LGIRILMAISCSRWRRIFKGLSQDEGRTGFNKKNLRASLFTDDGDLSNEPTFS